MPYKVSIISYIWPYSLAHNHEEDFFDTLQGQYYILYMDLQPGSQNIRRAYLTPYKVSITSCILPYRLAHKHEEGLFDALQGQKYILYMALPPGP